MHRIGLEPSSARVCTVFGVVKYTTPVTLFVCYSVRMRVKQSNPKMEKERMEKEKRTKVVIGALLGAVTVLISVGVLFAILSSGGNDVINPKTNGKFRQD